METATISFPIFGEDFVINVPRFFTIFGYNIYVYGLFITAGFVFAALYLIRRSEALSLTKDNVLDLVIMAVPCGLIGARLYYIIFNASHYFGPGNWKNIIMLREGGLAVYGGVIGGAIAFLIYARKKKIPIGKLLDAASFGLFIGQAIGRWGNFFNRESYGVDTTVPWRMGLITNTEAIYVHPTFLYESLWNIVGFVLLHVFSKKRGRKYYGQYFLFYLAWYGLGRSMIEGLRIDSLLISGTDIRVSQLLAILSLALAVVILVRNRIRGATFAPEPEIINVLPEDAAMPASDKSDTLVGDSGDGDEMTDRVITGESDEATLIESDSDEKTE